MKITAVWSEASFLHDPGGDVWIGVPIEGDETADRARAMHLAIEHAGLEIVPPQEHPDSVITAVHDPGMLSYLRTAHDEWVAAGYPEEHGQNHVVAYAFPHPTAFRHAKPRVPASRAARAGIYCMDTCTTLGPGSYRGIRYAVDSAVTAADLVLGGGDAAYAAVRPPGHHAGTDYFGGSCYLNNAAIAAQRLLDGGSSRVGIVDIDAHHGNGTQEIFYERSDVLYASVHIDPGQGWFPHWSGFADETGSGQGKGLNHNIPLDPGDGDDEMVEAVDQLTSLVTATGCEAMVVSLGVDSGVADENSPLLVNEEGFSRVGEILGSVGLPTVLVHEGGYHLPSLERDLTALLDGFQAS